MAIGIYARQSVDKKDSISIEAQIDYCKRECGPAAADFIIYKDKGFSGKNTSRPSYKKMVEDIRNGKLERIVVYRLDRLSRSITDFGQLWETMNEYHVSFTSVNEKFDTDTPMGRAMVYIIMVFAQLERETVSERVKDNYYERMQYGSWLGGPAPYGFKLGKIVDEDGRKKPTLIPDEKMEIVKRIFEEYSQDGMTLGNIAKELSQEGIPAPKRETWDTVSLSRILHSPLYVKADIDIYSYYKRMGITKIANEIEQFDGSHAAQIVGKRDAATRKYVEFREHTLGLMNFSGTIPSGLWLECQEKLSHNRQLKNTGKGKYTWLTGLLKCASCGYAVTVKKGRDDSTYLACSGRYNAHVCEVKGFHVTVSEIEDVVEGELIKILDEQSADEVEVVDASYAGKKVELIKIDERIERLISCIADSEDITVTYLNQQILKLDQEKRQILEEMEKMRKNISGNYSKIDFGLLDMKEKHLTAATFIEKVLVGEDGIEIVWKV